MKENILEDYEGKKLIYQEFEQKVKDLILSLILENKITIHTIESRVKNRESLSKKIDHKEGKYDGLEEITDTLGLRIITYFEDDVDRIAEVINKEFYVDEENSVDKRLGKDPNTFGYASLHYIVKLKDPRSSLPEYSRFCNISFELQIRSILQHAWAEIEHDIGYKNSISIPKNIRRNFSRMASLLELADIEFIRIKEEINKYSKEVQENIKIANLDIRIDKISLEEFIKKSNVVRELDKIIARELNAQLIWTGYSVENHISRLSFFNIRNIRDLNNLLNKNRKLIIDFSKEWLSESDDEETSTVGMGISIFYLGYILVAQTHDEDLIISYLSDMKIGHDNHKTMQKIQRVFTEIQ